MIYIHAKLLILIYAPYKYFFKKTVKPTEKKKNPNKMK